MKKQTDEHVAVVTGCTSGLGLLTTAFLLAAGWEVIGWADSERFPIDDHPMLKAFEDQFTYQQVDVRWADEIIQAVGSCASGDDNFRVDALINCAGVNYLAPFEGFDFGEWERLMDVNAKALALTTRALLPYMAFPSDPFSAGTVLNIVSNAAQVPMTHSLAYNASKAAALMVTRQLARELFKSHGLTVFSISPNKLAGTNMSREIEDAVPALRGWTPEEAAEYQRAALPTGMETEPRVLAEFIGYLLSSKERHIYLHGCNIPYGG
jgi:NAD(P)-dependent dehydrogenase (short-subunit alcohol dehydrogenase family)